MTVGMSTYFRIKDAEEKANSLGFRFKSNQFEPGNCDGFILAADEDKLPAYRPNVPLFRGSLEEMESFLQGIEWARQYDRILELKTDQRRERAEQRLRNEALVNMIKESSDNGEEEHIPF